MCHGDGRPRGDGGPGDGRRRQSELRPAGPALPDGRRTVRERRRRRQQRRRGGGAAGCIIVPAALRRVVLQFPGADRIVGRIVLRQLAAVGRIVGRVVLRRCLAARRGLGRGVGPSAHLRRTPRDPAGGGRERAGGSAEPQVSGEHGGHERRSGADPVRPGSVERRQQLRHVLADLRRRHRRRLRGRPPRPAGRPEADHGSGSVGRAVPAPRTLRRRRPPTSSNTSTSSLTSDAWGGSRPIRSRIRATRRDATTSSGTCTRRSRRSRRS